MTRPTLLTALLLLASAANAYELKHDSTGAAVHWGSAPHFVIDAGADQKLGEPQVFAAVQAAVESVDRAAPALAITVEAGEVEGVGYDRAPGAVNRSEIVIPEDWDYDPAAIAVTVVTVDTSKHQVIDADIAFNAAHRRFKVLPPDSRPGFGDYDDIQNALTHELGHAVGLAHNPDAPGAVMYPGARKGEVSKRTLSTDDVEGLRSLYPQPLDASDAGAAPEGAPAQGCSSAGSRTAPWALVLILLAFLPLRRRPRPPLPAAGPMALAAALLCLGSAPAFAAERTDAALLQSADRVVTGEVISARPLPAAPHARLWFTELEVRVRQCVKVQGACPATIRVRVPGGRMGTLEQVVEDHPVPAPGEQVAVAEVASRALPRLYRLEVLPELVAFARAVEDAGLTARLQLPVSPSPSRSPLTLSP